MRFFIFMPLIPGLIIWAIVSLFNHAREQAAAKQLLAILEAKKLEGDASFKQQFGESQPRKPLSMELAWPDYINNLQSK